MRNHGHIRRGGVTRRRAGEQVARSQNRRLVQLILVACLSIAISASADEQSEANVITGLGVTNLAGTLGGLAPEPLTALISEGVAFTSNIALKALNAKLVEPGNRWRDPNSNDQCTFDFTMDQSHWDYSNLYGITTNPVPDAWGELGAPEVYHWGTEVIVSANNPYIPLGQNQPVSFPAGRHTIEWKTETIIDPAFDVLLPGYMLYMSYSKFKASKAAPAAVAGNADEVAKQDGIFKRAGKWMIEKLKIGVQKCKEKCASIAKDKALNYLADEFTDFETVSRTKRKEQTLTVYDTIDPIIAYNGIDRAPEATLPALTLEATDIGGVLTSRVRNELFTNITAYDPCSRTAGLSADLPDLLLIGDNQITWTARDSGPARGAPNNQVQAYQNIIIEDTQAPIMVTPAGQVIEVDPAGADANGLARQEIDFGSPRVVDLADASPSVFNDAPIFFPVDTREAVTWTARDASGNESTGDQLITVKTLGTNTAPIVDDVFASTLTSQPVDIVLSGQDNDFLDGVFDPLSIALLERPANGEFVAPLLPFFINDFRTAVEGPYGQDFATSGNRSNWLYNNVCQQLSGPSNDKIPLDWVYAPQFVHVEDDGTYFMIDRYWKCGASNAQTYERISKWSSDDEYLGQIDYGGTNDAFVMDEDGLIYSVSKSGAGSSTTFRLAQIRPNLEDRLSGADLSGDSWRFDYASTENSALGLDDPIVNEQLSYARVDSNAGLIYVTDRRRVFIFDVRDHLANDIDDSDNSMGDRYLGALKNAEQFLCVQSSNYGSSWTGFTMEVDSEGSLYVTDSCDSRIHKFEASGFDADGNFQMGDYVGWMGRCESSTTKACDVENQRSRGYACTNETCQVSAYYENEDGLNVRGSSGKKPGQFATPRYIDLDPNDVLYVADAGRIQRFAKDGAFGGEAKSTGTGINQGERPGFVLGNLGTVKAVTVNSNNFFVVDQQESFVHVFETTPLKDITERSATVTYVSNFNFHSGVDSFTYRASDGLANSNVGRVDIQVDRNYRPPEAFPQIVEVDEDDSLVLELTGDDPDGVIGSGDVFPLDVLTFDVVDQPAHGSLSGANQNWVYQPDTDFNGSDEFTFVANDGVFDSESATVFITVNPVDDAPRMRSVKLPMRVGAGFPITMQGKYSDDGSPAPHDVVVDWGNVQEGKGDFVDPDGEGGEPPRLDGVKMIEPPLRDGEGDLFGEHVYSAPGAQSVVVCVEDDQNADCLVEGVVVERLVNLDVQMSDEPLETTANFLDLDLRVENVEPQGIAGLNASNVRLTQPVVPELKVLSIVSQSGSCSLANGEIDCLDSSMVPGEAYTATVRVVPETNEPLIYDLGAPFAVDVSTDSESLQDIYPIARWVTFVADKTDSDGDGMTDVYEQTYGLNPSNGSDASRDDDGDRLTNLEEYQRRSNPTLADTDGDGVNDRDDFCPEDPGGTVEGTDGVCEAEIRRSPVLRLIQLLGDRL